MYADDGLIISDSEIPFKNLQSEYPNGYGLYLSNKAKKDGRPLQGRLNRL